MVAAIRLRFPVQQAIGRNPEGSVEYLCLHVTSKELKKNKKYKKNPFLQISFRWECYHEHIRQTPD